MKKQIVYLAAGVLVLSAGIYCSTRLWAQQPVPAQPAPQTHIGILNLGYVLKNYQKVDAYTQEMKDHFNRFDGTIKAKKTEIEGRQKQLGDTKLSAEQQEAVKKEVTRLQREIEDMNNDMKKFIGEKTDQQMVTIYREIQEAAARYAVAHGLDMVLTHIDAVSEADYLNPMNVMGKMQQRARMPLYYNKGLDVSKDIVLSLNANYQANPGVKPASATTPTVPGH